MFIVIQEDTKFHTTSYVGPFDQQSDANNMMTDLELADNRAKMMGYKYRVRELTSPEMAKTW